MGHVFLPSSNRVEPVNTPGCWVELAKDGDRQVTHLIRLELDLDSPLTPRTSAGGSLRLSKEMARVTLEAGVWWCTVAGANEPVYLRADEQSLKILTRAQAYCALGAVERLLSLGLGDAAICLSAGDFDLASVQLIAHRDLQG